MNCNDRNEQAEEPEAALDEIALIKKVVGSDMLEPTRRVLGLLVSDQVKWYRVKCLISISQKLEKICRERKISITEGRTLAMRVGLPLLERASFQDNEYLQDRWANLIASVLDNTRAETDRYNMDIAQIEALHQFEELDCRVLEYIVEHGIEERLNDGTLQMRGIDTNEVRKKFHSELGHLSLDKLSALGCIERVMPRILGSNPPSGGYGTWGQEICPTLFGVNLYIVASGKEPSWILTPREPSISSN